MGNKATEKTAQTLQIDKLTPYPAHPFKLYEGERLDDMVRSVRELGVLQPVIVRPLDGTYEILSGHNRVNAAKLAGLTEVPVIIKTGLSDEEAKLIVTETNLVQRSFADLSHSEKAIALKLHMNAISRQGKRNDLINEIQDLLTADELNTTYDPPEHKLNARERTAKTYELSPSNVMRYIRVAQLIRPLLDRVDAGEIAIRPALSLSYLSPDEQERLNGILDDNAFKVDMKKADALRELSEDKTLVDRTVYQILSGELDKPRKAQSKPPLKIRHKIYSKFFSLDAKPKEMEATVEQALTEYFANHSKSEERTESA
jgi:ParB family chromosome partitioning protein